jgi:RNA polymerase sigma-70 factor, ECF subfamily
MLGESPDTEEMLQRAAGGDQQAFGELFARHRSRLQRMVQVRMDRRLQGRIDSSDVLQEAYLEASRALAGYLQNPYVPFFLWLRLLTGRKLLALHRHHLGVKARDARREVSLDQGELPQVSSVFLAEQLLGRFSSPSQAAVRAELRACMQAALDAMEPMDREVLSLRHFEQLSNAEAAQVLGLSEQAASNRFVRALKRLRETLSDTGLLEIHGG